MKTRIFGAILVIVVLGVLYVLTDNSSGQYTAPTQQPATINDPLQGLRIN